MGGLAFTVAGENLMAHSVGRQAQDRLTWYLGPLLHWLAANWVALFHEQHFSWVERSADPAASVCNRAIARFASIGAAATPSLSSAEAWYRRHGLSSAACGGLFRDIFLRRFADDSELSWTAAPPRFAPVGFTFETEPGVARLAVADVAEPLWQALSWVRENPPALETPEFREDWTILVERIDSLDRIAPQRFSAADIAEQLLARVRASFHEKGRSDLVDPDMPRGAQYVIAEAPAVAMFGGLSVEMSDADIATLRDALIASASGTTSEYLNNLVENAPLRGKPWEDGYDLAEDFLNDLIDGQFIIGSEGFVDVRAICRYLEIPVSQHEFESVAIRGVALAGSDFGPSIIINNRSVYNYNEDGRRFTIAHELCHILHDQSRARRLAHTSGPWAAPGIEKRANAFAAWLLMPPWLLQPYIEHIETETSISVDRLQSIANSIRVANTALVEHLFNLNLIDEVKRDELRAALRAQI